MSGYYPTFVKDSLTVNKKMKELFSKIYEPAYLYAFLIFIGYFNEYTFYIFFGFNILSYLTFGELLLSFLNLTIPLLILSAVIFFMYVGTVNSTRKSEEEGEKYNTNFYSDIFEITRESLKELKVLFQERKWKWIWTYINIVHRLFQFLISIAIFLFAFLYPLYFLLLVMGENLHFDFGLPIHVILGFGWLTIINILIKKFYKKTEHVRAAMFLIILLIFIGTITIINRSKYNFKIEGKENTYLEFVYENETIKTKDNLVFVGQTENYLFVKDVKKQVNYIYNKEKIDLIKIITKKQQTN